MPPPRRLLAALEDPAQVSTAAGRPPRTSNGGPDGRAGVARLPQASRPHHGQGRCAVRHGSLSRPTLGPTAPARTRQRLAELISLLMLVPVLTCAGRHPQKADDRVVSTRCTSRRLSRARRGPLQVRSSRCGSQAGGLAVTREPIHRTVRVPVGQQCRGAASRTGPVAAGQSPSTVAARSPRATPGHAATSRLWPREAPRRPGSPKSRRDGLSDHSSAPCSTRTSAAYRQAAGRIRTVSP